MDRVFAISRAEAEAAEFCASGCGFEKYVFFPTFLGCLWMTRQAFRLRRMAFVIRADDEGRISWITPPNDRGFPALADRSKAAVFPSYSEAQTVVNQLSDAFGRIGVQLFIESAD